MNESGNISKEGKDPKEAVERLGKMIDKMVKECPNATILVSLIIDVCHTEPEMGGQLSRTQQFRELIPGLVRKYYDDGKHVLAADLVRMGDWWYDFIHQIPGDWLNDPEGKDPVREDGDGSNGGIDKNIPPPDWGTIPIIDKPASWVKEVADWAKTGDTQTHCNGKPQWKEAGKIALGVGSNGDWKFHKNWILSTDDKWGGDGKVAEGISKDPRYVRLVDMDGDGKADYVWVDPESSEIICWINNLPDHWTPAGNNKGNKLGTIGSGVKGSKYIYLALDDYIYLKENGGTVIYRSAFENPGNKWEPLSTADASGIGQRPEEIELIDINGDGKADYLWKMPIDGSVRVWLNDYPNLPTWREIGVIAAGVGTSGNNIRWATLPKGGRPDYVIVDPKTGALGAWLNGCNKEDLAPALLIPGKPPVCNKESDFPGHVKIQDYWVKWASDFCDKKFGNIDKRVGPGWNISGEEWDEYKHKVRFTIKWREGCTVSKPRKDMDVLNPMEDYSVRCWQAFQVPWKYCWEGNNGVGPYQDIRCLRYQVDAGV